MITTSYLNHCDPISGNGSQACPRASCWLVLCGTPLGPKRNLKLARVVTKGPGRGDDFIRFGPQEWKFITITS